MHAEHSYFQVLYNTVLLIFRHVYEIVRLFLLGEETNQVINAQGRGRTQLKAWMRGSGHCSSLHHLRCRYLSPTQPGCSD